jgi:hypothetical protein
MRNHMPAIDRVIQTYGIIVRPTLENPGSAKRDGRADRADSTKQALD